MGVRDLANYFDDDELVSVSTKISLTLVDIHCTVVKGSHQNIHL